MSTPNTKVVPNVAAHGHDDGPPRGKYLAFLSLGALGIVYGDIGTSPIYALRESLHGAYGVHASPENVLGVLSLIFWSLILVISIKYLGFIMRADNRGEGGIIALTALVIPQGRPPEGVRKALVAAGLFGAALLYGDSMITPAISVLSAVEGLEVATPFFQPYVIPITVVILLGLFSFQRFGTASVGSVFGPIVLVWFLTLGTLGVIHLADSPEVFRALNPVYGAQFFIRNGIKGFLVLGSVFLVVTGGEALYADMGHFGRLPIRLTWFAIVLPALLLNYFGQGAMVIAHPETIEQPFYLMAPRWALYPLVGLTTVATVIASQAVISGAFSLTRQAVQLGYLPRLEIKHTSKREIGQIYIAGGQLGPDVRLDRTRHRLRIVEPPGRCVRRCSDHGHGVHDPAVRVRGPQSTRLVALGDRAAGGRLPDDRPGVLGRQPAQDPARRVVPARRRGRDLRGDDDVAEGKDRDR